MYSQSLYHMKFAFHQIRGISGLYMICGRRMMKVGVVDEPVLKFNNDNMMNPTTDVKTTCPKPVIIDTFPIFLRWLRFRLKPIINKSSTTPN